MSNNELLSSEIEKIESHEGYTIRVVLEGKEVYSTKDSGDNYRVWDISKVYNGEVNDIARREIIRKFARITDRELIQNFTFEIKDSDDQVKFSGKIYPHKGFESEDFTSNNWLVQFEGESAPRFLSTRYLDYKTRKKTAQEKKDSDSKTDWMYVTDKDGNRVVNALGNIDLDIYSALQSLAKMLFTSFNRVSHGGLTKAELVERFGELQSALNDAIASGNMDAIKGINESMIEVKNLLG